MLAHTATAAAAAAVLEQLIEDDPGVVKRPLICDRVNDDVDVELMCRGDIAASTYRSKTHQRYDS